MSLAGDTHTHTGVAETQDPRWANVSNQRCFPKSWTLSTSQTNSSYAIPVAGTVMCHVI